MRPERLPRMVQVWVIQEKASGLFLNEDLFLVSSLKQAGRCHEACSAVDTGIMNLGEDEFEVHTFFEFAPPDDAPDGRSA